MKIIITVDDTVTDAQAVACVNKVILEGKISNSPYGPTYCLMSVFKSGVHVAVKARKTGTTFYVSKPNGNP